MQEVFAACHEYVSPMGYQLQCRADVCKCGAPCLCSILAHYARTCRRHGVIVEFRSHVTECGESDTCLHITEIHDNCIPIVWEDKGCVHTVYLFFPAIACPPTMEYGVCVSLCQRRCLFLSVPQPCGDECEEGCVCPEGTYLNTHTHTCVPQYAHFDFSFNHSSSTQTSLSILRIEYDSSKDILSSGDHLSSWTAGYIS